MQALLVAFMLAQGGPPCVNVSDLDTYLPGKEMVAHGRLEGGDMMLIYADEEGDFDWVLVYHTDREVRWNGGILSLKAGMACVIDGGGDWENLSPDFGLGA